MPQTNIDENSYYDEVLNERLERLIVNIQQYNPSSESDKIRLAFDIAKKAHGGQHRDSGEEYILHPLAVAEILAGLQLDDTAIMAGFLHDVVEDTSVSEQIIKEKFGEKVMALVDGVTKLSKLEFRTQQERQAENLRKMFLAMSHDIRIILLKLADRLHNMRTLKYHRSPERRREIAEETLTIFAPLAHRLGIFSIKSELEDLSLSFLEPEEYQKLNRDLEMVNAQREQQIKSICETLKRHLLEVGIEADISGRCKSRFSIYNKMKKQNKDLSEIFDLNAVRIIVNTVKDCYGALGIIHTRWKPIPGRFKDYIAMPKQNMYQSIHTTLIGDNGEPFEVQIRTWEMHRIAEYGIAAHWRYKEGKSGDADFEQKVEWLRQMLEWQQEMRDAGDFLESVKVDLFQDNIYVFSPKGDVFELQAGSCPIDFAYRVHTQVGHQCTGARVNRRLVPLDTMLHNGDIVEIITTRGKGPNRDWLKVCKTQQAKSKIRQWFRKETRDENIALGRELLEKECKRYNQDPAELLKPSELLAAAKRFNIMSTDDLYAAIGYGALQVTSVLTRIKEDYRKGPDKEAVFNENKGYVSRTERGGIWVKGVDNLLVRIAHCCSPLPGDDIIGYITRGRGVSVHRTGCPNIKYYKEQEADRLIEV
ncbi:MAG: bifunctional (p)ppGpp synthetase/guanosine-3',5'-bis(diphosphate) 3'-pyrophosphohydrolase, partial [Clostridia bacterium]|nr:bifunctional (p)ppGpp synthetase/guanosine-3',5'-bis(diphosphate) 3'-pyrophosphohydrolase [Clostridia bacterium]